MPSSQSFSRIQRRISDSPDPACPENSGRAGQHDPDPGAGRLHVAEHVLKEQERPVGDPRQARAEPSAVPERGVLVLDRGGVGLPVHAVGRVGEDEVELLGRERVLGEGVAVAHPGRVDALHHQVGLGDGPGLVVELLPEDVDDRVVVEVLDPRHGGHEHPAGARGRVVDGAHRGRVLGELAGGAAGHEEIDDELDDLAGGVVLPGGLVAHLGELPQQLFEDVAHRLVRYDGRAQVEVGEVGKDGVEEAGAVHPLQPAVEVVGLDDPVGGGGELGDVVAQVGCDVLVVAEHRGEREARCVVERVARGALQQRVDALVDLVVLGGLGADLLAGRGQDGVHPAQHQQRQHHRAVLVLLERPPQLVGDLPDEGDFVLEADWRHFSPSVGLVERPR